MVAISASDMGVEEGVGVRGPSMSSMSSVSVIASTSASASGADFGGIAARKEVGLTVSAASYKKGEIANKNELSCEAANTQLSRGNPRSACVMCVPRTFPDVVSSS